MDWPRDVDGDVFRRLKDHHFDFSRIYRIDFNIDFDQWPPAPEVLPLLIKQYPGFKLIEPESDSRGFIQVHIENHVTYDFVMKIQAQLSGLVKRFNGRCNSWGVLQG